MRGVIKSLMRDRGFGFIRGDGGKTEYFFHASDLVGLHFADLEEGDRVVYEIEEEPRGPRAREVREWRPDLGVGGEA